MEEDKSAEEKIRARAYELYVARGEHPGRDEEDWLQAEQEILASESSLQAAEESTRARLEVPADKKNGQQSSTGNGTRPKGDTPRRARG